MAHNRGTKTNLAVLVACAVALSGCSTAPVLREVCGDLGLYFDPDDPDALAALVDKLMQDTSYRESLRQQIAEAKPRLRTWKTVAGEVLAALRAIKR